MMSTFDPTLALTLLTHPFQVALMVVTLGALLRQDIRAVVGNQAQILGTTSVADPDLRAAA